MKNMTVKDILESNLIEDSTEIRITFELPNGDKRTQRGTWHQDHILEMSKERIKTMFVSAYTNSCHIYV